MIMLVDYMLAEDFPTAAECSTRRAALLHANLEEERYHIYSSLMTDTKEAYADAVKHLANHFERGSTLISERANFTRRVLLSSENMVQCSCRHCVS